MIGKRLADYEAKGQPINSYARILSSINSKNNKSIKIMYLDVSKYTLKGLQANVLPPLEEWKAEWKTKSSIKIINLSKNFRVQANYRKNNLDRYKRRDNEANKKRQKDKYRNEEGLTKTEVKRRNEFINIARLELEGLSRKLKKVYNKINYLEILEEVKVELDDDKERVRESR